MPPQTVDRRKTIWLAIAALVAFTLEPSRCTADSNAAIKAAGRDRKTASTDLPNVKLRRPKVPAAEPGSGLTNPIDLLLNAHLKANDVDRNHPVSDAVFARRVYLDLVGLLPPPTELDAFVARSSPDKRAALVRELLARREDYAVHWLAFWNDLLRNEYRGTGFIDDGRRQITRVAVSLALRQQTVRPLRSRTGQPRARVRKASSKESNGGASSTRASVAKCRPLKRRLKSFLGTNLKCASCHDSFISQWTLADSHGLAAIVRRWSSRRLPLRQGDGRACAGQPSCFPELGTIDADAPRAVRMKQLADRITDPKDGRLATTVDQSVLGPLAGPRTDRAVGQHGTGVVASGAARLARRRFDRPSLRPQTHLGNHLHVADVPASRQSASRGPARRSPPFAARRCGG